MKAENVRNQMMYRFLLYLAYKGPKPVPKNGKMCMFLTTFPHGVGGYKNYCNFAQNGQILTNKYSNES